MGNKKVEGSRSRETHSQNRDSGGSWEQAVERLALERGGRTWPPVSLAARRQHQSRAL